MTTKLTDEVLNAFADKLLGRCRHEEIEGLFWCSGCETEYTKDELYYDSFIGEWDCRKCRKIKNKRNVLLHVCSICKKPIDEYLAGAFNYCQDMNAARELLEAVPISKRSNVMSNLFNWAEKQTREGAFGWEDEWMAITATPRQIVQAVYEVMERNDG